MLSTASGLPDMVIFHVRLSCILIGRQEDRAILSSELNRIHDNLHICTLKIFTLRSCVSMAAQIRHSAKVLYGF